MVKEWWIWLSLRTHNVTYGMELPSKEIIKGITFMNTNKYYYESNQYGTNLNIMVF